MARAFWHRKARDELEKLQDFKQKLILEAVGEFEEKGTEYEKFSLLEQDYSDSDFYRIKLKQENQDLNHRILISEFQNMWVIYGLKGRDEAYDEETILEMGKRQY